MNITIHFDHDRDALELLAELLNDGYRVSIDLDVVEESCRANAKARIKASQARADELNAQRDRDHAEKLRKDVDRAIKAAKAAAKYDAERAYAATEEGQARQAVYDARYAEAQAARIVECSACGAAVDYPCVTPQGKPYGAFVHTVRIRDQHMVNLHDGQS